MRQAKVSWKKFRTIEPAHKQQASQQTYGSTATCLPLENPLRLIMNNYIRFPLSFYMTQKLARNVEGDFIMWN